MAEQKSNTENIPLRERRKLLRAFRKQYGITLTELGKLVRLTNPMLSQFENGKRDLSPDAWTRVLAAIQKLVAEDEARRKQEREKALQTAAKLTSIDEVKRKSDVEAATLAVFDDVWGPVLSAFKDGAISVSDAISVSPEEYEKSLEQNARRQIHKHINQLVTQRNYWQEAFHSQSGVISELQKRERGRTKKASG